MTGKRTTERDVAALSAMNIDDLRCYWVSRWKGPAPALRSGDLLRRCIAERLQTEAFGGDSELDRRLGKMARAARRGEAPKATKATFRSGSVLIREYEGRTHRVVVTDGGFEWENKLHHSLSEIARAITGVRWNGPRFFGLREAAGGQP